MVRRSEVIIWLKTWRIAEGLVNVLKQVGDSHTHWWAADRLGVIRDPMAVELSREMFLGLQCRLRWTR
ncbi:MAG: hypothetical protein WED04_00725 [Promethearchaeati archaeon SRVP18_Atabeyarchaeia-1]